MKKNGFTLLEILLALVVMAGSVAVVATAWSGNFGRVQKSQVLTNVSLLLQKKMTELEAKNKGKKVDEIQEEEGDFGKDFPEYRWSFETQPFEMPDISALLLNTQEKTTDTMLSMFSKVQESFSKSILEGRVTIFVKAGPSELQYSVTTYFVDFENAKMDIGGGG